MIILATNNENKVLELSKAINKEVHSLKDLNLDIEVIEDGDTLESNAYKKAYEISLHFPDATIISDDTGLFVKSLNGAPGVYSARYAGETATSEDNIDLLLKNLEGHLDRSAYFETVIVVYKDGEANYFSGKAEGTILDSRVGANGFGYDSIFYYEPLNKTFAELTIEEKGQVSHRANAMRKVAESNLF